MFGYFELAVVIFHTGRRVGISERTNELNANYLSAFVVALYEALNV